MWIFILKIVLAIACIFLGIYIGSIIYTYKNLDNIMDLFNPQIVTKDYLKDKTYKYMYLDKSGYDIYLIKDNSTEYFIKIKHIDQDNT